ncbi:MAG: L,D-transpeptidase family protein [Thermaerobacter sp.]|nr:L,D-transpeptidase family protein [Thermaerobacter sp.]
MLPILFALPIATPAPAPPPREPVRIVIDTDRRTLTVYSGATPYKVFPCAVGKPSTPTPLGEWAIQEKASWGGAFGTRWMRLTIPYGIYGVHGTSNPGSIGSFASHGCVRMFNRNVEQLYRWVQVGTPVSIIGTPPRRTVYEGDRGSEVTDVQITLESLGYYEGPVSGIFTPQLAEAVALFQAKHGIRPDGIIGRSTYEALGLYPPRRTSPAWLPRPQPSTQDDTRPSLSKASKPRPTRAPRKVAPPAAPESRPLANSGQGAARR